MQKKVNVRQTTIALSTIAILTAALIVISMFCTIKTETMKISLTFIPVTIAARLYGVKGSAAVAGLGDIIGWIIRPLGPLFLPITFTEIAIGVVFGLFLYKNVKFSKIAIAVSIAMLLSAFITPVWLHMLYGTDYIALLIGRIPQILIMTAIEMTVIPFMMKALDKTLPAKANT